MIIVICFFAMVTPVSAYDSTAYSWYCIRNKENKQPKVGDNLNFVEKFNGYYIDHKHDDNNQEKVVYLTFDAGYENGNIEKILDVMKDENICGSFFILGNLIKSNGDLVNRMANEGHTVANHTYSHKDITKLSKSELENELSSLNSAYRACTGKEMSPYFRPPEGKFSETTLTWAQEFGYKTVFWSFAYADWDNQKQMSPQAAKEKILSNIHNGAILLLHPTSQTNATILKDIICELKAKNYEFKTLDDLFSQQEQLY